MFKDLGDFGRDWLNDDKWWIKSWVLVLHTIDCSGLFPMSAIGRETCHLCRVLCFKNETEVIWSGIEGCKCNSFFSFPFSSNAKFNSGSGNLYLFSPQHPWATTQSTAICLFLELHLPRGHYSPTFYVSLFRITFQSVIPCAVLVHFKPETFGLSPQCININMHSK